jgi:uncharacterized protein (TIGR02145 family)/prepilin-type N-terminal cleavage/methylation domain-containing protein
MKKGFTLIELLAVIVILAIIALISSPIIIGLIDNVRKEAFKDTGYGIIEAGELLFSKALFDGTTEDVTFKYTDGLESSPSGKTLEYNGTKPKSGTVKINSEGQVAIAIHNGKYCNVKSYEESEITLSDKTEEDCKLPFECGDDLVDSRDSNTYKTVLIGTQCWMADNLRYIADTADIGTGNDCTQRTWSSGTIDVCRKANNQDLATFSSSAEWLQYEVWYQWGAANTSCPEDWKLPTDIEWTQLTDLLGENPGTQLKAKTPLAWNGTDDYGFNALPAGVRNSDSSLVFVDSYAYFWTSTTYELNVWRRNLYSGASIGRTDNPKNMGLSVRCLLNS